MCAWWVILLIATNPEWLGLPGSGSISNFAYLIAIYIPAGVLIADVVGQYAQVLVRTKWNGILALATVILLSLGGAWERMRDLQIARHALVTRPDIRAMAWVREHTPNEAVFLVNSFFAYGGGAVVGSDGGWWLPLLAGRANTVPPLNYTSERGPDQNYVDWVNALTAQIQAEGIEHPRTTDMLRAHRVTHIYIGQRQGRVNYEGPHVLQPALLLRSGLFRLLYHQDRVWVFQVVR